MEQNGYIGKICPFCKTRLDAAAEVVVCSECGMPHHRECWVENRGCTTYGCLGTIQAPEQCRTRPVSAPELAARCAACGFLCRNGDCFCGRCGAPQRQDPEWDALMATLVGEGADAYLAGYEAMRSTARWARWNWAAFCLPACWCVYRKRYLWGIGLLAAVFTLSFQGAAGIAAIALLHIAAGVWGTALYMRFVASAAKRVRTLYPSERGAYLARTGGTNASAAVVTFFVLPALFLIIRL